MEWEKKHNFWKKARPISLLNPAGGVQMLHLIRSFCGVSNRGNTISKIDRLGRVGLRESTHQITVRYGEYRILLHMESNGGYNKMVGYAGKFYRHNSEDHHIQRWRSDYQTRRPWRKFLCDS